MAEDPITTNWIDVFDRCTRYSKSTIYAEHGRYDACAAPERAGETVCTWIAALGRACSYLGIFDNWISDQRLYDYCTRPGIIEIPSSDKLSSSTCLIATWIRGVLMRSATDSDYTLKYSTVFVQYFISLR